MINLDSILKSRDITLPTKGYLVKAMVFPVVMYGWESWTIKTAEGKELMIWTVLLEKTLEIPLDCQDIQPVHPKGHQSWLFIGRMDAEAELPILWPPDVKSWLIGRPWCWERLKAGGEGVNRGWDGSMASLTQRPWVWVNSWGWWCTGKPGMLQSMRSQSWTGLSDWTELIIQLVKNLPAMQETPAWFLGGEDLIEKGYATHSSIPGLPLLLSW